MDGTIAFIKLSPIIFLVAISLVRRKIPTSGIFYLSLFFAIMVTILIEIVKLHSFTFEIVGDYLTQIAVVVIGSLIFALVSIYAIIFANSLADYVSVVTSRYIFFRANEQTRVIRFFGFLILDILAMIMSILVNFLILYIGFASLQRFMKIFSASLPAQSEQSPDAEGSSDWTSGYIVWIQDQFSLLSQSSLDAIQIILHSIVIGFSIPQPDISITPLEKSDSYLVILLVFLFLTSSIPTLVNFSMMLVFISAKSIAFIIRKPVIRIHHLFLDEPKKDASDYIFVQGRTRSSLLIGAIALLVLILLFEGWKVVLNLLF